MFEHLHALFQDSISIFLFRNVAYPKLKKAVFRNCCLSEAWEGCVP